MSTFSPYAASYHKSDMIFRCRDDTLYMGQIVLLSFQAELLLSFSENLYLQVNSRIWFDVTITQENGVKLTAFSRQKFNSDELKD